MISDRTSINGSHLTSREVEILELMARGFLGREIGPKLGIAGKTVEVHLHNARRRVRVRTSFQLLAMYVELKTKEQRR